MGQHPVAGCNSWLYPPMNSIAKQVQALDRLVKEGKVYPKDFKALVENGLDYRVIAMWYMLHELFEEL